MAKSDLYNYQIEDVTLSFSFTQDHLIKHKKSMFIHMLEQAAMDLRKELAEQ